MKKLVISLALTILLGPGAGHLYLRRFLQGFLLIMVSFVTGALFFVQVLKSVPAGASALLEQNPAQVFQDFYAAHGTLILYFDVIFAALWAYALVDVFFRAWAMREQVKEDNEISE